MFVLLGVSTTFLYSCFDGDVPLPPGSDNHEWIAIVQFPMRASLRLTDTIYFQLLATPYYLPFEHEVGIGSGLGGNWNLGLNGRLNHEFQWNGTMFRVYDYLTSQGN